MTWSRAALAACVAALASLSLVLWRPTPHAHVRTLPRLHASAAHSPAAALISETTSVSDARPLSTKISALLARSRLLGPAEKSEEDEIRCALDRLLRDDNAATIVAGLSPADLNSPFGLAALARWAHVAPVAAAWWLAQRTDFSDEQATVLARELVSDLDVLAVCCDQLPAGHYRNRFLAAAALASHAAPAVAVTLIRQLPSGPTQTRALRSLVFDWATIEPNAAAQWIAAESPGELRDQLAAVATAAHASIDPAGSIAWANATISSEDVFEDALQSILAIWAESAPRAATDFIHRLPRDTIDPVILATLTRVPTSSTR